MPSDCAAQHRLLVDEFYVPLTADGDVDGPTEADPNIATLYSQASGLTYFLMFADDGRYRGAPLIAYLSAVYQGRDRAGTLAEMCRLEHTKSSTRSIAIT